MAKGRRSILTTKDAEEIAKKLKAEIKTGRHHETAIIRVEGKEVGRFGIRRGTDEIAHDFISRQIYVSTKQAVEISTCKKYRADYENILRMTGKYPT